MISAKLKGFESNMNEHSSWTVMSDGLELHRHPTQSSRAALDI